MKTAEEFLKEGSQHPKGWTAKKCMIEFAKYHVEQALKQASIKVSTRDIQGSILKSYPLENIK